MIRLIVGLGNPGPEYEATRHNAGFWWVDEAARQLKTDLRFERSYHGLLGRGTGPHGHVWLLQPMTFMNLSGKAVAPLARFFKITPGEILVVHDELDLPPGQVKMKKGGSAAGHNGLKDIQAQLGSPDFWRLRLGIGHPGDRSEVSAHVLRKPPLDERALVDEAIARSLKPLRLMLEGDMDLALARIHAKPPRPKPPRQPPGEVQAQAPSAPSPSDAEASPTPVSPASPPVTPPASPPTGPPAKG